MFEWFMAHSAEFSGVVVAIASVFGYRVYKQRKANVSIAKPEATGPRCDGCMFWDWEEGQANLRAEPRFWNDVAPHVSPQRMMERYTPDGELIPQPVKLRAKENSWGAFGYCGADENLTHCAYKCDKYKAKAKAKTQ